MSTSARRHHRAYYLCRLADPAEYARNEELEAEHPRYAYLREDQVIGHVDRWLAQLFDPECIEDTLAGLVDGAATDPGVDQRAEAARRRIAAADVKIERHRAAIEAGADPKLVTQWLAEAKGERLAAETELAALDQPEQVTADDLAQRPPDDQRASRSTPEDKAALLTALGVSVSYDPVARTARVTCTPRVREKSCRRTESCITYTADPQLGSDPAHGVTRPDAGGLGVRL